MNRKKALVAAKAPKDYKLLWMVLPFIASSFCLVMFRFLDGYIHCLITYQE